MSETLYTDIRAALVTQLSTMTGVPAVAWENSTYSPVVGTPYLIPSVLWAEGSQAELGVNGRNWERGIYQITAVYPANAGVGLINAMAGKIRERFKRGTELVYNGVTVKIRKVYLGPQTIEAAGIQQPVSIAFYSQVAN